MVPAAELAAAALLDTLRCAAEWTGAERCHLALAGSLAGTVREPELRAALRGWTVFSQRGAGFAARLAHAHAEVATSGTGSVVQIGMDTPQLRPEDLEAVLAGLAAADAVLAPAVDGGWWALALRDPARAGLLRGVPMSTPETARLTREALASAGLTVATGPTRRDVDTAADAEQVAACCPGGSEFARVWAGPRRPSVLPERAR